MSVRRPTHFLIIAAVFFALSCNEHPYKPKDFDPPPDPYRDIDGEPDWSRVADIIVFTHLPQDSIERLNGYFQIWTMDLQTRERKFITSGRQARWSPDGRHIAFLRDGVIWVRNLSNGEEKKVTPFTAYFPTWSYNNNYLAFDTPFNDPNGSSAIWIISLDSTILYDISIHGTGEWRSPDWSPDGKNILHYRYIGVGTSELFIMDTTGQNAVRLTDNIYQDESPRYSFDGSKIVWVMNGEGDHIVDGIWIMNTDGSEKKWIARGGMPSFSRDGTKIIYYGPIDSLKTATLLTVNIDGTNVQPVWLP